MCAVRYRPIFDDWSVTFAFMFDAELLDMDDVIALLERAGSVVGIGPCRPETGGPFGRFSVDHASIKEW